MEQPQPYKPQKSIIKEGIELKLQEYYNLKEVFFLGIHDTEESAAPEEAARNYKPLLFAIHALLELTKPDNTNDINTICLAQHRVEQLQNTRTIDDDTIAELRALCGWIDTTLLIPYATALKPQLRI